MTNFFSIKQLDYFCRLYNKSINVLDHGKAFSYKKDDYAVKSCTTRSELKNAIHCLKVKRKNCYKKYHEQASMGIERPELYNQYVHLGVKQNALEKLLEAKQ